LVVAKRQGTNGAEHSTDWTTTRQPNIEQTVQGEFDAAPESYIWITFK